MTASHLHLLLNHVPTVGAAIALAILAVAYIRRDEHLRHIGLEILFVVALVTLPAYVSGAAAHRELRNVEGVSDSAIRMHQDAAIWAFTVLNLSAFFGWLALWQMRRRGTAAFGIVPVTMILLLISLAMMAGAGNLGGQIRHPEVRTEAAMEAAATTDRDAFMASKIGNYLSNESPWAWPAMEAIHFLGMSLSIGVLLALNLRILGAARSVPFHQVHRLLPWGMLGFGVNIITGMLFVVATPGQYVDGGPFIWKVGFLMIAGANFLYLTVFKRGWTGVGLDTSLFDKGFAVVSIFSWLAVLYAGRMLPFLGNAF